MFQTKVVQKIKTHILCSIIFFENYAINEIMWKNIVELGRPHDNIAHAHCVLGALGYRHTLRNVKRLASPLQQPLHKRALLLRRTLPVLFILMWCSKSRFQIAACTGPVVRRRTTNEYEAVMK
jgi:hypothetical protein